MLFTPPKRPLLRLMHHFAAPEAMNMQTGILSEVPELSHHHPPHLYLYHSFNPTTAYCKN